jgi:hypothetical protein
MCNTFKSGDLVPNSGVYTVLHSTPHKLIDRRMCVEGAHFRGCKVCPLGVLYRLEVPCVPTAFPVLATSGVAAC